MVLIPILVLLPEGAKNRAEIIRAGADVVLETPYDLKEVELQAYALIRRYIIWESKETGSESLIEIGSLNINILKRVVYWNQMQIDLVKREFDLLYLLAATPGRVYTYSQIYQSVWKEYPQDDVTNMIYCLVHRLKKKLRKIDVKACDIICSVKQVGYCLKVNKRQDGREQHCIQEKETSAVPKETNKWLIPESVCSVCFRSERSLIAVNAMKVSVSPLIFLIAAVFTIFTVSISTRKPAKKAAKISPLEAICYTGQENKQTKKAKQTHRTRLSYMAFSNLGRNKRRSAFIVLSMLLCIVLFNSIIVITQSMDEEKWISRSTKTDFTVYNSVAVNGVSPFRYRDDGLPASVVDLINQQQGVEKKRILYRNTRDDHEVTVDYKFEDLVCIHEETEEDSVNKAYENGLSLRVVPGTQEGYFGNVFGVSEAFWDDVTIYEGEKNLNVLKEKMKTGDYVIVGTIIDRLTGKAEEETELQQQLQVGDSITFSKDGNDIVNIS